MQRYGPDLSKKWPDQIKLNKNKIAASFKVPEPIFDNRHIKNKLHNILKSQKNIHLLTESEVVGITKNGKNYSISYTKDGQKKECGFGAILNATYSNINYLHKLAGLNTPEYQYELCEMAVMKVPWKKPEGMAVMDGHFFGIMPFGFSKEYLLYDVDISVLERCIGKFPKFKHDVSYYDNAETREKRFGKYIEKIKPYIPQISSCKNLYSIYATRIVLPHREKDDARPTVISNPKPGFWTVFAGKITTCIPASKKLASEIFKYLEN